MKNSEKSAVNVDRTIKLGIDLGTTNSEVAVNNGGNVEVVKNAQQDEYTPSVFGIDKSGNKVVGKKAYDKLFKSSSEEEYKNNKAEVKRLMGTGEKVHFERTNTDMSAEEISAEILKSLKEDVNRKYPDMPTTSAVITIPAYFSALQAEATKRAGKLAGFDYVVLLQEPIAAAMAYGFNNTADENWLVYDLGGGTFDVALISSKEGLLTVLGHNGNNYLGGKDFDNLIIDSVIRPAIQEKFNVTNFDRNNPDLRSVFARLKALAEAAKIELSQYDKTIIEVEDIGKDDKGKEIYVSIELKRSDFEELIQPKIEETIELSGETIKQSGVQTSKINKIVLVGGPTQIPFLQEQLEKTFKLKIDATVDPLTVVARGATVYGMSQQVPQEILEKDRTADKSEKKVILNYESLTAEEEQTVTGIISELKDSDEDYFIQIQGESGHYTSSKIKLRNGKFFDTVTIEPRKTNLFWIYLFDNEGNAVPLYPESFSITNGLTVSGAPIPHTIGVIYARKGFDSGFEMTEVCDPFFEKNSVPPLKKTESYKTLKKLVKGKDNKLPIKIYEGESSIPDRNQVITTLHIDGKALPHDLPEGSEVDLTITVDESRAVSVEAHLPSIDKTLNVRADEYAQEIDVQVLEQDLATQRSRLKKVEDNCSDEELGRLENRIDTVSTSLKNAELDDDEKNKADRDLRDLKQRLDDLEKEKAMPQLKAEFKEAVENATEFIALLEDSQDKFRVTQLLEVVKEEGEKAIAANDRAMLIRVLEQVREIGARSLLVNPGVWVWQLDQIKASKDELSNQQDGEYYIDKADKAISQNDFHELQRCVRALLELLPKGTQEEITTNISGITK